MTTDSSAPEPDRSTDVIVIGAGAVGENVADRAHRGGLEVLVVERELVGGECSYWACMPSKALLRPGAALAAARRVAGAAQAVTGGIDAAAVLERRTSFTSGWDDASQVEWVRSAGLELARGDARLVGPRLVEVTAPDGGTTVWQARRAVVVATGSVPVLPGIDGLADAAPWGTREATSARSVPGRLVVIGAGVAGTELAQAWCRLGSTVTLLARGGVLAAYPEQAGSLVADALRADGVDVRVGVSPTAVHRAGPGGPVTVTLDDGSSVEADEVLVATGRRPATDGVGLDDPALGLDGPATGEHGELLVDDSGRSPAATWLYGAGDVTARAMLTHQGKYDARVVGDSIAARADGSLGDHAEPWSKHAATADHSAVPQVVFTDPEVASVGMTEQAARDAGTDVRVVSIELAVAGSAVHADGYTGWAQMVVDESRGVVVGVTFVGQDVSELLHAATIAVVGEVPVTRLWHAVPAYPTISEVWLRLLEAYGL